MQYTLFLFLKYGVTRVTCEWHLQLHLLLLAGGQEVDRQNPTAITMRAAKRSFVRHDLQYFWGLNRKIAEHFVPRQR